MFDEDDYKVFRFVVHWLDTVTARCDHLRRLAGSVPVCFDAPLTIGTEQSCLVMSFGTEGDWSFEQAMAQLGCEVLAFSLQHEDNETLALAGIAFQRTGLWSQNGLFAGEKFLTLDAIAYHTGRDGWPINYLKVCFLSWPRW